MSYNTAPVVFLIRTLNTPRHSIPLPSVSVTRNLAGIFSRTLLPGDATVAAITSSPLDKHARGATWQSSIITATTIPTTSMAKGGGSTVTTQASLVERRAGPTPTHPHRGKTLALSTSPETGIVLRASSTTSRVGTCAFAARKAGRGGLASTRAEGKARQAPSRLIISPETGNVHLAQRITSPVVKSAFAADCPRRLKRRL